MSPSDAPAGSRGSEWRRWDPHIHAPGTLLSNHFAHTEDGQPAWEKYLTAIESADPPVAALGITDYFSIRTYKRAREQKAKGRIPGVALVFPNVELRLDIKTEKAKPINLHLLFSPEDPQHELEIERALSRLECEFGDRQWRCTESDLTQVGRIIDPSQRDDLAALAAGANQFKVTLTQVKKLFREDEWVRRNCLVAVAGSNRDGTAGLQGDDSYALTRREIERFSHIIFAATPKQRDFWLGKGKLDRTQIETRYHSLKPCLHGSDAHREADVAAPDLERYCWLKGDATFETLRQALIEPEERVWLGPAPPPHHVPQAAIEVVSSTDTPWLARATLGLNPGLVAVIGARGSGKTALVEVIARAAGAPGTGEGESSFLSRASRPVNLLGDAAVKIVWRDGSTTEERLAPAYGQDEPVKRADVAYLSQQFVDRLCSSEGLARELRSEMERVIFDATDPIARLDSDSFSELEATLLEPARRRGDELRNEIRARTREIIKEDELLGRLPSLVKEQTEVQKKVEQAKKDLAELLPKGTHQRAKVLSQIEQAHATMQTRLEAMTRRRQALEALGSEVGQIRSTTEPRRFADMSRRHAAAELPDESWRGFAMKFSGDVDKSLAAAKGALDRSIEHATHGDPKAPVDERTSPIEDWPLNALRARRDATAREVGLDGERQKKYDLLRKSIEQSETAIRRLSLEIERAKGAQERRRLLIDARRQAYADVFDTFAEAEAILAKLYEPLSGQLKGATGALRRMEFFVHRRVDLDGWVTVGERDFLDLRLNTRLRGHGALKLEAEARLLPALSRGAAKDVAAAMDSFRSEFAEDLRAAMPRQLHQEQQRQWTQSMAEWLYSTDHIQVEYGIRFDGSAIERLSPGTRGIVLRDPSATPGCGS